jgi:hypothetical protein
MSTPHKPVIQLRRPPPPPVATVEAFIAGRPDVQAPGGPARAETSSWAPSVQASERQSAQESERPDIQAPGPSGVQSPERLDAQASGDLGSRTLGGPGAQASGGPVASPEGPPPVERSGVRTSGRSGGRRVERPAVQQVGIVRRADGRVRRRLTVYLPVEVAKRLVVHCAATEIDISDVVTDAVHKALESA